MLTRLPRTVAFTTRRGMATYRKVREPYGLKKVPSKHSAPSRLRTEPRKYAPVDNPTSFGLRPPEKEPWKPDDDRFDIEKAREVAKPLGGAPQQHIVVRSVKKGEGAVFTDPETEATRGSRSEWGSQAGDAITRSCFLIVRRTTATVQDMQRALQTWEPLEIYEVPQQFGCRDIFLKFPREEKAADARRYYLGRELFYGVKVNFEFGTEKEFAAVQNSLITEPNSDGTPLHTNWGETPPHTNTDGKPLHGIRHSFEPGSFESSPSNPGYPSRTFRDNSAHFPMPKQRLPDGTYEGQSSCIYLGNVPFDLLMDKRDIWKRFQVFGEIRDIRIPVIKPMNSPKGFCYIRFNRVEDAVKLYESLMREPLVVQGRTIRCDFDSERPGQIKTLDGQPSTCLMLDHVPLANVRRPESLYRALLAYGDVQDVRIARGGQDSSPLGPVYIEYSNLEETKAAERAINSGELAAQIGGVQVVARFAAELHQLPFGGNGVPSKTLYLGRVPSKALLFRGSLLKPFERYGQLADLRIPMEDGWPKGYCYIEYSKLSDAIRACEDLQTTNQLMFYGKPLHVAYAAPRGERSQPVPGTFTRPHAEPLSETDRMKLLEEHLNTPFDRSRIGESPTRGVAAASDGTDTTNSSAKSAPNDDSWGKYGLK